MQFQVEVVDPPTFWKEEGAISLLYQDRIKEPVSFVKSPDHVWTVEVAIKDGIWTGPNVARNGDGRKFIYFVWVNQYGGRFRRLKLYQEQVTGEKVRIRGTVPRDGSPACATAILYE